MHCDYCMTQLHLESRPHAIEGQGSTFWVDQLGRVGCPYAFANLDHLPVEELS